MSRLAVGIASALVASAITAAATSPLDFWNTNHGFATKEPVDIRTDRAKRDGVRAAIKVANARASARHAVPVEFMDRLTMRESGFRFVRGPATRYGYAYGPHQILCSTAASLGERDCSRLMRDAELSADISARYVRMGYDATGSWQGAAAWYHGGPDKRIHGRKTAAYAQAVGAPIDRSRGSLMMAYAPPKGVFGNTRIMPASFAAMTFEAGR